MGAEPVTATIQAAKLAYDIYQATQSDGSKRAQIQRHDLLSQLQPQKAGI
jgi:hypothetical protein